MAFPGAQPSILTGALPMPSTRRRQPLPSAAIGCAAVVYGIAFTKLLAAHGVALPRPSSALEVFAAFVFAAYVSIFAHECGHLLTGFACGFALSAFRVWPFVIASQNKRISFAFDWKSHTGYTMMRPTDFSTYIARKGFYALGGPAASAVLGVLALCWLLSPLGGRPDDVDFSLSAYDALIVAPFITLFNLIPMSAGPFRSDGAQALAAFRRAPEMQRELAVLQIHAALSDGVCARDLDDAMLAHALEPSDGSRTEMWARLLAYMKAAGHEAFDAAAEHLERALQCAGRAMPAERAQLVIEAAVFNGWFCFAAGPAKVWLERARRVATTRVARARVEIVSAWIAGDRNGALSVCDALLLYLRAFPQSPQLVASIRDVAAWRDQLAQRELPLLRNG